MTIADSLTIGNQNIEPEENICLLQYYVIYIGVGDYGGLCMANIILSICVILIGVYLTMLPQLRY